MKEENGAKKSKKGLIIGIIIAILIILIIAGAIGGYAFYHGKQISLLTEEANKITAIELLDSDGMVNKEAKVDMQIKTNGSYAIVEKTLKDYINETLLLAQDLENIYDEKEIEDMFSIENLKNDGPDFVQSKAKINEMKEQLNDYLDKFINLCDEENMLSAIEDKNVSDYYKNLYKQLATDSETSKELKEAVSDLENAKQKITNAFDYLSKVFNYLSDNKESWTIQNNQIMFYSQEKLDNYKKLLEEAQELEK